MDRSLRFTQVAIISAHPCKTLHPADEATALAYGKSTMLEEAWCSRVHPWISRGLLLDCIHLHMWGYILQAQQKALVRGPPLGILVHLLLSYAGHPHRVPGSNVVLSLQDGAPYDGRWGQAQSLCPQQLLLKQESIL